jgi:hypothetical protein
MHDASPCLALNKNVFLGWFNKSSYIRFKNKSSYFIWLLQINFGLVGSINPAVLDMLDEQSLPLVRLKNGGDVTE